MTGYIYIHIVPNGKVYIGQTTQLLEERFLNGNGYIRCSLFYKAIKKYGWINIKHKVLEKIVGDDILAELNKREKFYIDLYKSNNLLYGYNLRNGGQNSLHSNESKKKMSEKRLGKHLSDKTKEKIRNAHLGMKGVNHGSKGYHHNQDSKNKISQAMKNIRNVVYNIIDLNGNVVAIGKKHELETLGYKGDFRHCANDKMTHKYVKNLNGDKFTVRRIV